MTSPTPEAVGKLPSECLANKIMALRDRRCEAHRYYLCDVCGGEWIDAYAQARERAVREEIAAEAELWGALSSQSHQRVHLNAFAQAIREQAGPFSDESLNAYLRAAFTEDQRRRAAALGGTRMEE